MTSQGQTERILEHPSITERERHSTTLPDATSHTLSHAHGWHLTRSALPYGGGILWWRNGYR